MDFTFETFEQDDYSFRAIEVWPADASPYRDRGEDVTGPAAAYVSTTALDRDRGSEFRQRI